MKQFINIAGIGELIFDHIFVNDGNQRTYVGSRGGGPVFNLLANIAFLEGTGYALGVGGADIFGEKAKMELERLGIETSNLHLLPRRNTRIIFEILQPPNNNKKSIVSHTFSSKCPVCCLKPDNSKLAKISQRNLNIVETENLSFVCFDRLTQNRLYTANILNKKGIKTVIDLGIIGFLRYLPAMQIVSSLNNFDIAVLSLTVAKSIVKRAGLSGFEDLAQIGPRSLLFITKGFDGMNIYQSKSKSPAYSEHISAISNIAILDDAGAGDAFLAILLMELYKSKIKGNKIEDLSFDAILNITHEAISKLSLVLNNYGARGHIPITQDCELPIISQWKGMETSRIRNQIDKTKPCPFCGCIESEIPKANWANVKKPKGRKNHLTARGNVGILLKRLFLGIEQKNAVNMCSEIIKNYRGTAYCVGTGGSYPVAIFLSQLLAKHGNIFSYPIRPFDYIRLGGPSDFVFVISYSGTTTDCKDVITYAANKRGSKIILITGAHQPKLRMFLRKEKGDILISYGKPPINNYKSKEHGFISFSGTVTPCGIFTAAECGPREMATYRRHLDLKLESYIDECYGCAIQLESALKRRDDILLFGGGLAWAPLMDLESKFVEGGLGKIQVHEMKDFSHGRFISVLGPNFKKNPIIVLGVGAWHRYEKLLIDTLGKDRKVVKLKSEFDGILGTLDLLIKIQYFITFCAEIQSIKDISYPKTIPRDGLKLFKWRDGLD